MTACILILYNINDVDFEHTGTIVDLAIILCSIILCMFSSVYCIKDIVINIGSILFSQTFSYYTLYNIISTLCVHCACNSQIIMIMMISAE